LPERRSDQKKSNREDKQKSVVGGPELLEKLREQPNRKCETCCQSDPRDNPRDETEPVATNKGKRECTEEYNVKDAHRADRCKINTARAQPPSNRAWVRNPV
jgi:hypothetical protein